MKSESICMKFEHVDDKLWQAREVIGIIVTANSIGVYISVHWFVTAQHDTLWQTVLLEQGCQVYMYPWGALLMGKKHDFVSKLLLFKTDKLYTFMLMEVGRFYIHTYTLFNTLLPCCSHSCPWIIVSHKMIMPCSKYMCLWVADWFCGTM